MSVIKSGDLVMLKSGGPVDTVNTDILDDNKITGVLCVWFVGQKLERVRFDHRALEPAQVQVASPGRWDICVEEAAGEYEVVLGEMSAAMNIPAEEEQVRPKPATKRSRRASAAKDETLAASPSEGGMVG